MSFLTTIISACVMLFLSAIQALAAHVCARAMARAFAT